jgi:CBS-domain-containing membrane protein
MKLFKKWWGNGGSPPPVASSKEILLGGTGGLIAIAVVAALTALSGHPLVLGSFGASCVLLFGFPDSPFAQPRSVLGGHVLSSFLGLACLTLFGAHEWSMALAVGLSISVMMATRTVHPPAGSNPVIIMLSAPTWSFLLTPTLLGAAALVFVALLFNNLAAGKSWPRTWR